MYIYLDSQIVEYIAKYEDFIFQDTDLCAVGEPKLRKEIFAIRQIAEFDQYGDCVCVAPNHLLNELRAGRPTSRQLDTYRILEASWKDCLSPEDEPSETAIAEADMMLRGLGLKDAGDRRHLAEALVRNVSWFLTNDTNVLRKTAGRIGAMRVSRPSECLEEISLGLFLR